MSIRSQAPVKFRSYLTLDGHVKRWPSFHSDGIEFTRYVCQNSPSVSANTAKFLCQFLDGCSPEFGYEMVNTLLSRRFQFRIHKGFYEWVLKSIDVLSIGHEAWIWREKVAKHIKDRHPRLLDSPISRWVNSDNKAHRTDGPAEIYWDHKEWMINDKLHREGGPALEWTDGHKEWWINGQCHREDGPAVEYADGERGWWINGQCHREDGPAVIQDDGEKRWYLNDIEYTKAQFNAIIQLRKTVETTAILRNESATKPLTGKAYAITGTLPINRAEAIEVIQNAGGKYSQSLNRDVILIEGKPTSGTTVKQRTAKRYKNKTIKWDDLIRETTPPPTAAEPGRTTHPTFQSIMDWLLSDKDNIHKTLEAIELVDVKANCEQL